MLGLWGGAPYATGSSAVKVAMIRAYNQCSIYVRKWLCAQEQESTLAKRNRADVETRARAKLRGKNREKPVES